jgi:hypothetical protein
MGRREGWVGVKDGREGRVGRRRIWIVMIGARCRAVVVRLKGGVWVESGNSLGTVWDSSQIESEMVPK